MQNKMTQKKPNKDVGHFFKKDKYIYDISFLLKLVKNYFINLSIALFNLSIVSISFDLAASIIQCSI